MSWNYALMNETREATAPVANQAFGSRRGQEGRMFENGVARFEEVHVVAAAKAAATQVMRQFGHVKGINSPFDAVQRGLLTEDEWSALLDELNQKYRETKNAKLRAGSQAATLLTGLRYQILIQLRDDSPIHLNELAKKIGGLRSSFRDQLMKMVAEGLAFLREDDKMVRLTPKGIAELEYRIAQIPMDN
jgi:DNA-binding MarR family transcriptional regulator